MTMIDLGEVTDDAVAPPVPLNLPLIRRVVLAVLTVAGLLSLAASALPPPGTVRRLWTTEMREGDTMALAGGRAYLNRAGDSGAPDLTAYDLAGGKELWRVPTGDAVSGYGPRPVGGLLLVPTDPLVVRYNDTDGSTYYHQVNRGTLALDAATGRELWRTTGDATPTAAGEALITEADDRGATNRLRLIRLSDGHDVWSRSIPPATGWTLIGDPDRPEAVATVSGRGNITIFGYQDGRARLSGRVPWTSLYMAALAPAGDHLAVVRTSGSDTTTTVYDPADLHVLWHTDYRGGYVTGCGPYLCTVSQARVVAHDPASGRQIWEMVGFTEPRDVGHGRLLVVDSRAALPTTVLADVATGRTIGAPVVGEPADDTPPPGDSVLLLRTATSPEGKYVAIRLDLADGEQTVLGLIDRIGDQGCQMDTGFVACARDGRLTVTAVG